MKKLVFSVFLMIPVLSFAQISIDAGRDTTFCESCVSKGTVVLGSNLTIKNGTPPYTYKWTTKYNLAGRFYEYAKDLLSDSTLSMPIFKSSLPNKIWQPFIVEVKDANQQIARDTINIRFSGFSLSTSQYMFFQHMGDEIEFNQSNIGGGIPPYRSYSWSPTVGLSSPNAFPTKCRVIGNQIYTLRAVDSVGCVAEDASYDVRVPVAEEPVLGETDSWNVASISWGKQVAIENFTLKGDTLIDSKLYKSVYSTYDSLFVPQKARYKFGLREEKSKWYFRFQNENSERLLYDFSLSKSDTISVKIDGSYVKFSILKVDTILLNGQFRKRLSLGVYDINASGYYIYDDWIEGIGSSQGLVYNSPYLMDTGTRLLCYHKNGNLIYLDSDSKSCGLKLGIEEVKTYREPIITQDRSINGMIQLKYSGEINAISIYNVQGKLVQQIFPQENSVTISLTNQPKGVYVLRLTSPDGIFVKKIIRN